MKQSRSVVPPLDEPEVDPFMDEAMAMVYVGDVYSLVAQEAVVVEEKTKPAPGKAPKHEMPPEENDAVWPFIR